MPVIWRNVNRSSVASLAAVVAFGLISPFAVADTNGNGGLPNFLMTWDASGDNAGALQYDPADKGSAEWGTYLLGGPAGQRTRTGWRYQGSMIGLDGGGNDSWEMSWDCVANRDPFVDATINVVNTSAFTQTFVIFMPLAIVPQGPGTIMTGSVSAVLNDNNFSGATLAAGAATPVYQSFIDGNLQQTLWNPGYSLNAPFQGVTNDTTAFGATAGPAALSTIAVRLEFTLSAGDSASVTGIFDIQPTPAPAGLAVFALFAAGAGRRRRA